MFLIQFVIGDSGDIFFTACIVYIKTEYTIIIHITDYKPDPMWFQLDLNYFLVVQLHLLHHNQSSVFTSHYLISVYCLTDSLGFPLPPGLWAQFGFSIQTWLLIGTVCQWPESCSSITFISRWVILSQQPDHLLQMNRRNISLCHSWFGWLVTLSCSIGYGWQCSKLFQTTLHYATRQPNLQKCLETLLEHSNKLWNTFWDS